MEYPLLRSVHRSLKRRFVSAATGGRFGRDASAHYTITALDGVSFAIAPGERVALAGHNGSGKTTLLRTLAGVYDPVAGDLRVQGSMASLFDISTGFDPEASGRENVYLLGFVMGMTRAMIEARMNGIRDFAGLGDFFELPLRAYSTGMILRLAFSVATSVRRDIVLMDEWLSVGDAQFSARAEQRLAEYIGGASILVLATHDPALIRRICTRRIELRHGRVVSDTPVSR